MTGNEKLLIARAEIEAVLQKHDIAGHVVLHMVGGTVESGMTTGYIENFGRYDPSYSRVRPQYDEHGVLEALRVHSKLGEHYNGDVAAQRRDLQATSGMLTSIGEILAGDAIALLQVAAVVDNVLHAEHTPLVDINPKRGTSQ